MRISFSRCLVDLGPAGISEAYLAGNLVKGFTRRVILGPSQDLIHAVIADQDQMGVAAGDDQAGEGWFQFGIRYVIGADVALDVVHSDQRGSGRECQSFGGGDADEERADQARTVGDRDGIQVLKRLSRFLQSLPDNLRDALSMLARSDLRYDASVEGMDIDLRGDHIGEDLPAVHDDGGRSLIAAGFYSQNCNVFFLHHFMVLKASSVLSFL